VILWDPARGKQARKLDLEKACRVALSPDGALLAAGSESGAVVLWDTAKGAERRRWQAHEHLLTDLAFSPDGRWLATASVDSAVSLWDVAPALDPVSRPVPVAAGQFGTCRGLSLTVAPGRPIPSVALSPDGGLLATVSGEGDFEVWDTQIGERLHHWRPGRPCGPGAAVAISPDGKLLAGASTDGELFVRELKRDGLRSTRWLPDQAVFALAFSPDGKRLACATRVPWEPGGVVSLYNPLSAGKPLRQLAGHEGHVLAVDFSPDGTRLVTGGGDGTACVWDLATGERLLRLVVGTASSHLFISNVLFTPDGQTVITAIENEPYVQLWDSQSGRRRRTLPAGARRQSLRLLPSGKSLVLGGGGLAVWDLHKPAPRHSVAAIDGHWGVGLALSADGRRAATGTECRSQEHPLERLQGYVRAWELDGAGNPLPGPIREASRPASPQPVSPEVTERVLAVAPDERYLVSPPAFSPDGRLLAAAANDGSVGVWEVESGRNVHRWKARKGVRFLEAMAFSSDGCLLAGAGERDLSVWDVDSGQVLAERKLRSYLVSRLWFLPGGTTLVGSLEHPHEDGPVTLFWDALTAGPPARELAGLTRAVSADGRLLVVTDNTAPGAWVVDAARGERVRRLEAGDGPLEEVALSPDRRLAASRRIFTVPQHGVFLAALFVWDVGTGEVLRRLTVEAGGSASFTPDGTHLIASDRHGLHAWNTRTGERVTNWPLYRRIDGWAVAPDGQHLAVAVGGTVTLWDLSCSFRRA
jgi:WD40 repeat protein